ncbi:hypothetical protein BDP55DRAFT_729031 [Colletotrichum godetiae]|uniref:Uncharacterized protein n=1 Tax=Colletotrichum godetiae TaxID=1209918 RepID=A0AAJ0AP44_9PEZI|nr:uncharacterized protein BDP55DRAFT_729031 [Colletotrichum godetiae]KAK1675256.1 hypothetical protein BDP55DRAFT_729031 [Colletotrichum godetiae]
MKFCISTLVTFITTAIAANCSGGAPKPNAPYKNRAAELCRACGPAGACANKVTSGGGVVCSMTVPRTKQTLYCEEAMSDILGQCISGGHSGGNRKCVSEFYECHAI